MKVFISILSVILFFSTIPLEAKEKRKIIYRYKKFEKFDFEDLVIEGDTGGPGDLSIAPRYRRKFKNKLPYRNNFNAAIRKGIERVR